MFEYLKGTVVENNASTLIIDVQNIGYKLYVAPNTIHYLPKESCTIYTLLVVRETAHTLYGFIDKSSRDLFEILINISGIGPKTALCILSQFAPTDFQEAILSENIPLISSVPGLGKKTAEKVILELKDKMLKRSFTKSKTTTGSPHHYDAIQALINLGFSERLASQAIEKVIKKSSGPLDLSEMITLALKAH